VVSWADRIAYSCHDLEDAALTGIVSPERLPPVVRERCGVSRDQQLGTFITALVDAIVTTGHVGMAEPEADALAALRAFNYEHIYLRPASVAQSTSVINVLRALVEHFADRPNVIFDAHQAPAAGSDEAVRAAVTYVGGMTDRYAFSTALARLGWDPAKLPQGIDTGAF
jgi:dGTPase